uniref:Proline dehydrogenase domain-containing protein n=1 Tax=Pyramimonas orientalis virus TaxID=455367 RepID=A0A7L9AY30_POV01|nr:hypothetical protein HWQ62_00468 [Pyramimonas orientalis virus]
MNRIFKYTTTEKNLLNVVNMYNQHHITPILDYAVEYNKNVQPFVDKKIYLFNTYPNYYHSFKLSSIDFRQSTFFELMSVAKNRNCKILLDAEDHKVQDTIDAVYDAVVSINYDFDIYKTYQMYRTDTMDKLLLDIEEFKRCNLVHNIKLVRGAYIMKDMQYGMVHSSKEDTDNAYNYAVKELLQISKNNKKMKVIFATHNDVTFNLIKNVGDANVFHASLMGMDKSFRDGRIKKMVHIPFGEYHETYPYLLRRYCENNKILDKLIHFKQLNFKKTV